MVYVSSTWESWLYKADERNNNKMAENIQLMKDFHCNKYIPFIPNQYQKILTLSSKRPIEGSIVLFRRPQSNNKNDPLALGRVLKEPNSKDECTKGYFTKNAHSKIEALPKMEQIVWRLTDQKLIDRVLHSRNPITTNVQPYAQSGVQSDV